MVTISLCRHTNAPTAYSKASSQESSLSRADPVYNARNLVGFVAERETIGEEAVRTLHQLLKATGGGKTKA